MIHLRWFLRAKRWVQNPPSENRIKFVLAIIAICLTLAAVERWIGWPDWLTVERPKRL